MRVRRVSSTTAAPTAARPAATAAYRPTVAPVVASDEDDEPVATVRETWDAVVVVVGFPCPGGFVAQFGDDGG